LRGPGRPNRRVVFAQIEPDLVSHVVLHPAKVVERPSDRASDLGQRLRPHDDESHEQNDHEFKRSDVEHAPRLRPGLCQILLRRPQERPNGRSFPSRAAWLLARLASAESSPANGVSAFWNSPSVWDNNFRWRTRASDTARRAAMHTRPITNQTMNGTDTRPMLREPEAHCFARKSSM
jgi:hypothetical protein